MGLVADMIACIGKARNQSEIYGTTGHKREHDAVVQQTMLAKDTVGALRWKATGSYLSYGVLQGAK